MGKGRDGQLLGQRYRKKDYLLSSGRKDTKKPPDITKNNGNNSTSTVSTAVLAWLSHFIQRLHLYPATRILIHSLIISCLDYCNNVCAKLFFFYPHTTRQFLQELPCLLCFSLKYPCCSHTFFLTVILLHVFSYI